MKHQNRRLLRSQSGQALVESIWGIGLIVLLATSLSVTVWLGWVRIELTQLTQELSVCLKSTAKKSACLEGYRHSVAQLSSRLQVLNVHTEKTKIKVRMVWLGRARETTDWRQGLSWIIDEYQQVY